MSLLRLLAVGKSFVSGRREIGRFKMNADGKLPNFSGKSGVKWTLPVRAEEDRAVGGVVRWFRILAVWRWRRNGASSRGAVGRPPAVEVLFRGGDRAEGARMIQQELVLERVRVQRNDLTDTDVEVVARVEGGRPREDAPPRSSAPSAARSAGTSGLVWNKMAAKLFVANRSRGE